MFSIEWELPFLLEFSVLVFDCENKNEALIFKYTHFDKWRQFEDQKIMKRNKKKYLFF